MLWSLFLPSNDLLTYDNKRQIVPIQFKLYRHLFCTTFIYCTIKKRSGLQSAVWWSFLAFFAALACFPALACFSSKTMASSSTSVWR